MEVPLPGNATKTTAVWSTKIANTSLVPPLQMQLFVQNSQNLADGFSRRFTARSEMMQYSHSSKVDPEHSIVFEAGQVKNSYHNQADVLATLVEDKFKNLKCM